MRRLGLLVLCGAAGLCHADAPRATPEFGIYEPSPAHPWGRRHPEAPVELEQFAFMLGENACNDRIRQPDGTWNEFPTRWNAVWFLNGFGIQDRYWTPSSFTTSNIRIFDEQSKSWKVTFFGTPRYSSGVWEGRKEGDEMVMRQFVENPDGTTRESRLTFYEISADGFRWKSETIVEGKQPSVGWTSDCKKVRP